MLGAATQTVTLSGSTIWAEREVLPLRNVPVVRPGHHARHDDGGAGRGHLRGRRPLGRRPGGDPFAIALETGQRLDYNALVKLATALSEFAATLPPERPLVVIIERDYAQALGQTVKGLAPRAPCW